MSVKERDARCSLPLPWSLVGVHPAKEPFLDGHWLYVAQMGAY